MSAISYKKQKKAYKASRAIDIQCVRASEDRELCGVKPGKSSQKSGRKWELSESLVFGLWSVSGRL